MPHVPNAPPGTRFFARIDRFHCECPACAHLIVAVLPGTAPKRPPSLRYANPYNPLSSILRCPSCQRRFGIGLVAWPLAHTNRTRIPADHQPTRRQLRELAQYATGIWAAEIKRSGDDFNIAIDQACRCTPPLWNARCPVHGWSGFQERQAGLEEPGPPPPVEYDEEEEEDPDD